MPNLSHAGLRSIAHWMRGVALALLLVASARAGDPAEKVRDRWYAVEMMGQRCGWMHATTTEADTIRSESEFRLSLKRGSVEVTIEMSSLFVETPGGKPIYAKNLQRLGQLPIDQLYVFTDHGVVVTSLQGKTQTTVLKPKLPEGWLPPAAAERLVEADIKAGKKQTAFKTVDPMTGLTIVSVSRTVEGEETITVGGKNVMVTRSNVVMSSAPQTKTLEYTDADGEMVRTQTSIGGISVTMVRATREEATGSTAAPELMLSTFVKPDRAIPNPRATRRATYLLSVPDGELVDLPATGSQRVERLSPLRARLTIDASSPNPAGEVDQAAYTRANTLLDANDTEIRKLRDRAVKGLAADSSARAEAIRRTVHDHITKKGLGVGFASASEAVRSREGDCTEHAVLLAATLRADGIPARAACGLVYVNAFEGATDAFGYHMWTQALLTIDGTPRWVDLDATFPADTRFDATHLTLGVSALDDGDAISSLYASASVIGRLQIKVEKAE